MPKKWCEQVKGIRELRKLCLGRRSVRFFVSLGGGLFRSSKRIRYDATNKIFHIVNEFDNTRQALTSKQIGLARHTNIGKAIRRGAFYKYIDQE